MTKVNSDSGIKTILIVEDDEDIRIVFKEALDQEGYHVITAENGKEGLERLREAPRPCLVLLDFMMPIMSGGEFLIEVGKDIRLAPIPVVIISASVAGNSTAGASAVVKKPVDLDKLVEIVEYYVGKSA